MPPRDPWATLGLPKTASLVDARRAFRRLARRTHPDAGGDSRAFAAVADAFRTVRTRLDGEPLRPRPTPYDWLLRPPAAGFVACCGTRRRPPAGTGTARAAGADFASVLAAELARRAA